MERSETKQMEEREVNNSVNESIASRADQGTNNQGDNNLNITGRWSDGNK